MRETVGKVVEVDENALANARTRLAALHEEAERIDAAARDRLAEFETEIAQRRDASLAGGGTALTEFEQQLAGFDKRLDERRVAQLARMSELGERSEAMATRLAEIDGQLAGHVEQAEAASDALARFTGDLSTRLTDSRDLLASSGRTLAEMTEASARMFELVRQSAEQSSQTIPAALVQAQDKLGAFETRALALRDAIAAAEEKGAALASHVDKASAGVPVSAKTLDALGKRLEDLATKSDALAQRTRKELAEAIAELEGSTQRMAERLKAGQEAALSEFAATFGERSLEVVGKGLREKTEAALAELDRAAEGAGRTGLATVGQLRTQLAELQEMAGNLEARVAEGRKQVQEEPTKDFSIEMTKIIEKLNGAALDITKIFDAEVPDVAWQAYMRGDYGVFTRKAVRLLSGQRADAIYGHYRSDDDFRETVNRYVRDFESMLRVVLATRNGHQMAVTLLSSDIGKLYVALAQATERLRE
jgi:myosin heavy subunit